MRFLTEKYFNYFFFLILFFCFGSLIWQNKQVKNENAHYLKNIYFFKQQQIDQEKKRENSPESLTVILILAIAVLVILAVYFIFIIIQQSINFDLQEKVVDKLTNENEEFQKLKPKIGEKEKLEDSLFKLKKINKELKKKNQQQQENFDFEEAEYSRQLANLRERLQNIKKTDNSQERLKMQIEELETNKKQLQAKNTNLNNQIEKITQKQKQLEMENTNLTNQLKKHEKFVNKNIMIVKKIRFSLENKELKKQKFNQNLIFTKSINFTFGKK